jgi:hypothetical protein
MNPLSINPGPLLAGVAVALALGFGAGWSINGWRLESKVATVQKDAAETRAASANAAVKMDQIRKDQKNAQAQAPLRPDCLPDAGRMRSLRSAVDAANAAIASPATR